MIKNLKGYAYFYLLLGVLLLVGCGRPAADDMDKRQEAGEGAFPTAYLGGSDKDLIHAKGKGVENTAIVDGKKVILSRVYQEKFLGHDCELTVMLSSEGRVEYALYSLAGDREALTAALSAALGKEQPDVIDTQEPGLGYKAIWRQKPYVYTMIAGENQVTVAIIAE